MTRSLPWLFAGLLACLPLTAAEPAAEEESGAAAGSEETGSDDTYQLPEGLTPPEEQVQSAGANDENFVPSVQITEDLPVAFPVDI